MALCVGIKFRQLAPLHDSAPIAFLVEQAGGLATNGPDRVLDLAVDRLRMRTPFVFGSVREVEEVRRVWG